MKIKTIGIFGYGKFGRLLKTMFESLQADYEIRFYSRSNKVDNANFFSWEDTCKADILIPSVPISHFEDYIERIAKTIGSSQKILMDVCSIKVYPQAVMKKHLHSNTDIICTHPNFGPESYRLNGSSLDNLNLIYHFERVSDETKIWFQNLLLEWKVNAHELEPEKHDREIGVPHFVSMLLGQVITGTGVARTELGAASTQRMFDMLEGVGKDLGILHDMYKFNPYCREYLDIIGSQYDVVKKLLQSP
jgi:prephenate dehydrogenase